MRSYAYGSANMQVRAFLDWIAGTVLQPARGEADCASWGEALTHLPAADWKESKARHGYKWAVSHALGFECMGSPSDMGVHFIAPGHALQGGPVASITSQGILWALEGAKAKLTRLDVAVDAIGSGLEIDDLAAHLEMGRALTDSRSWNYVTAPGGGQTLYVGARSSDRFVRIYNKQAELAAKAEKPAEADWKRIELEAKATAARAYGRRLITGASIMTVANDAITAMIDFPESPHWRIIFGAVGAPVAHSHRALHDTQRWLLGTVAKSLARQLRIDPTFKDRFEAVVRAFLSDENGS